MMHRYSRPSLIEYGAMVHLTMGSTGSAPDFIGVPIPGVPGGVILVPDTNNPGCLVSPPETSCLTVAS
jgi:hypothetical protein